MNVPVLDITRLVSRLGRGPLTGVDRVELAYLRYLMEQRAKHGLLFFLFLKVKGGFALLKAEAGTLLLGWALQERSFPATRWYHRLFGGQNALRVQVELLLRPYFMARCFGGGLAAMLRRLLPPSSIYFNVGHSNLSARVLSAMPGRIVVLVHDVIPLEYPEFTKDGITDIFEQKMRAVCRYAHWVVHTAYATRQVNERHFARLGRVPAAIIASLGIDEVVPVSFDMPSDMQGRSCFVALGTIEPRKNHALLLDLWQELAGELPAEQMPYLMILGHRGWKNEDVFNRLDQRPPYVVEIAGLSDGAVQTVLSHSSGLLFPSYAEGFGLPPVEAALMGVPVFSSPLACVQEILKKYPVYLDPTNYYDWVDPLKNLIAVERADGILRHQPIDRPTWEEHFKIVFEAVLK